jgi:hypothetical protein
VGIRRLKKREPLDSTREWGQLRDIKGVGLSRIKRQPPQIDSKKKGRVIFKTLTFSVVQFRGIQPKKFAAWGLD